MKTNMNEVITYIRDHKKEFEGHSVLMLIDEYESIDQREVSLVKRIKEVQDEMLQQLDKLKGEFDGIKANKSMLVSLISKNISDKIIQKISSK